MTALVQGPGEGEPSPGLPSDPRSGPLPAWRAKRRQFGLRHLMGLSVVLGVVFAAIANAMRTGEAIDAILAGLAIGLAVSVLGAFLALRLERWGSVGWLLVCVGPTSLAVAVIGASTEFDPVFMTAVALFVLPVMAGAIVHVVTRLRAAHQEGRLWVLALAADRDRPLGPALTAYADQSSGVDRLRTLGVAECLDHGLTLPDALEFVRKSAPASARLLVRVGHESGRLAEALRDAAAARSARPPGWQSFGGRISYLCLVLLCLQGVAAYVIYQVTPRFESIFRDFGLRLPAMTLSFIGASRWLTQGIVMPALAVVEGLFLLYLPLAFGGYAELHVPFLDVLFLRRHAVMILRSLAMVVDGDRPIGLGLQILARWYPTDWVRERLAGVHLATERGLDWIEALRRYALISATDVALLESARRAGNLPWALRELADGSARRLGYRLQAFGQVMMTLVILALAAFVAAAGVAYFYPFVYLIERLNG